MIYAFYKYNVRQNADIIVFPEYGLTTIGMPRERELARPYLVVVPQIGSNPCLTNEVEYQVLTTYTLFSKFKTQIFHRIYS